MDNTDEMVALLTEIRDTEREHLAEYRRTAERTVSLQEAAARAIRRNFVVGGVFFLIILSYLVWTVVRFR